MVEQADFARVVLPHLDEAYSLARWLTGSASDAEDVVQDALMKALKHFAGFRGPAARPWLLTIVRRTCFTWLAANRPRQLVFTDDDAAVEAMNRTTVVDPASQGGGDAREPAGGQGGGGRAQRRCRSFARPLPRGRGAARDPRAFL